jgi:hypothetical protein
LTEVEGGGLPLFGGPDAVSLGRITTGDPGFLISGNRVSGAAVWLSSAGELFRIVEGAPVLATGGAPTWAGDAVWFAGAWVVVGATTADPLHYDAASWRSTDGQTWTRLAAQTSPGNDALQVVTPWQDTLVALGVDGDALQTWRLHDETWVRSGSFGSTKGLNGSYPQVVDLDVSGATMLAAVTVAGTVQTDGSAPPSVGLWTSPDGGVDWAQVALPAGVGAPRRAVVAAAPDSGFLLVADDGTGARVFLGTPEPAS